MPIFIPHTVTNVGRPKERYTLSLDQPSGVMIEVILDTLEFTKLRQNLTYTMVIIELNVDPRLRFSEKVEGQLGCLRTTEFEARWPSASSVKAKY